MEEAQNLNFNQLLEKCFLEASGASAPATILPPASGSHDAAKRQDDPALRLILLLDLARRRAAQLSLVNPEEETLREVSTAALRSLFIPSLAGEAEVNVRTSFDARQERKSRLAKSKAHFTAYIESLRSLKILPPNTDNLLKSHAELYAESEANDDAAGRGTSLPPNAALAQSAKRRELKIALFKTERSLKTSLEQFRTAVEGSKKYAVRSPAQRPEDIFYDPLFLTKASAGKDDEDEDDEDDGDGNGAARTDSQGVPGSIRAYILLLLNLHAIKASTSLESAQQELQLLASMPAAPPRPPDFSTADARERGREGQGSDWRLDRGPGASGSLGGPLLDPKGKPLRPFTITGSSGEGSAQGATAGPELDARQRIRQEVFRPSHRLPTMSIDEYLEEERRRGNIIEGGGAKSMEDPTPREARALRAEEDGTREAEEAEEEKRREEIEWDEFKEANPKGIGNTMNRG